jgi:RNA polymerase sigma-70 factor, ECF subfamily
VTKPEQDSLFGQWLDAHAAVLHHVANGFAEGVDRHDLMQEVLLAVWRAIPAFRGGAQEGTFIYRVAHNAALTWKRTQKNYRRRIDEFELLQTAATTGLVLADDNSRDREALKHIYAAIRELPPLDRSIILLHLDGLSYAQMAEIHGMTEGNVGVRLNRSKQKLTTALENISHELR